MSLIHSIPNIRMRSNSLDGCMNSTNLILKIGLIRPHWNTLNNMLGLILEQDTEKLVGLLVIRIGKYIGNIGKILSHPMV